MLLFEVPVDEVNRETKHLDKRHGGFSGSPPAQEWKTSGHGVRGGKIYGVRFEPCGLPKRSLTGDSTERVDTRVLQVIYSFQRGDLPLFVGQQMNVFIDAPARTFTPAADKPAREAGR